MAYINDCKEILSNYNNLKHELLNLFEDQLSLEEMVNKKILMHIIDYQCYFKIYSERLIKLFSNGNNVILVIKKVDLNNLKNNFRFKEGNLVYLAKGSQIKFNIINNLNLEKSDIRFKQLFVESEV